MNSGIWEVGVADLCTICSEEMAPEYVMRCMGNMHKGKCERCAKDMYVLTWRYTMNKAGLEKRGRLDG